MQSANLFKKIFLASFVAISLLFVPALATAQAPSDGLDALNDQSEGVDDYGIQADDQEGVVELIATVIDWALYISGAIAVVFVIIGGYRYLTSGGNEEQATTGRKTVINALIGLVIIMLAYVIVNVVVGFIVGD